MKVLAVALRHFRNLTDVVFEPEERFTVLHGENGQGKTNVIEALFLLGTLTSFRARRVEELIQFGAHESTLGGRVRKLGTDRRLEVTLTPGHKKARVDDKSAKPHDYFGGVNMVLFGPEELDLVRGSPSVRRRFLDRAIWNLTPHYLEQVGRYEKILRSRAHVLKEDEWAGRREELLEVYDGELAKAAVPLVVARADMVAALRPLAIQVFRQVIGLDLQLVAKSSWLAADTAPGQVETVLRERLAADRKRDLARGLTSSGPHNDDLMLLLDGRAADIFGSQGQVRTIALALKIAEIELLRLRLGDMPVLLLDDVSSELDAARNQQLFAHLSQLGCQTFVTTTHPSHVWITKNRKDYHIVNGSFR